MLDAAKMHSPAAHAKPTTLVSPATRARGRLKIARFDSATTTFERFNMDGSFK